MLKKLDQKLKDQRGVTLIGRSVTYISGEDPSDFTHDDSGLE